MDKFLVVACLVSAVASAQPSWIELRPGDTVRLPLSRTAGGEVVLARGATKAARVTARLGAQAWQWPDTNWTQRQPAWFDAWEGSPDGNGAVVAKSLGLTERQLVFHVPPGTARQIDIEAASDSAPMQVRVASTQALQQAGAEQQLKKMFVVLPVFTEAPVGTRDVEVRARLERSGEMEMVLIYAAKPTE